MKQSFKDRRDESKGTEKFDHSRAYSRVKAMDADHDPSDCDGEWEPREIHYECNECNEWHIDDSGRTVAAIKPFGAENMGLTQYILVDQSGSTQMMSLSMSSLVVNAAEAAQDNGYAVEIIGYSTKAHPWTGEPKDYLHEPRGGTDAWVALEYIAEQNGGKLPTNAKYLFIVDEDMHPRYFKEFKKELNGSNTKIVFVTPSVRLFAPTTSAEDFATHVVDSWNDFNTGIPMSAVVVKNDEMIMKSWEETGSVPDNTITVQVDGVGVRHQPMFSAENMGLTQYVGSAGGSGDGTPVSYGGIALPESDVAAMVESSTENPMGASIGTVMGTMGAEEVPVVPDPSSFPQGDGRVLGQQTDQANLSPLHAEGDDVQMVKIQDPVTTGAKMALGVVALNATAIAGAALIGLALTYSARKEE
jgi:peroxiredoxin